MARVDEECCLASSGVAPSYGVHGRGSVDLLFPIRLATAAALMPSFDRAYNHVVELGAIGSHARNNHVETAI